MVKEGPTNEHYQQRGGGEGGTLDMMWHLKSFFSIPCYLISYYLSPRLGTFFCAILVLYKGSEDHSGPSLTHKWTLKWTRQGKFYSRLLKKDPVGPPEGPYWYIFLDRPPSINSLMWGKSDIKAPKIQAFFPIESEISSIEYKKCWEIQSTRQVKEISNNTHAKYLEWRWKSLK